MFFYSTTTLAFLNSEVVGLAPGLLDAIKPLVRGFHGSRRSVSSCGQCIMEAVVRLFEFKKVFEEIS
jgi:hypothetical protein